MGTTELRVVIVVMVVGAFPNTAGAQDQDSKHPHQSLSQPGMRQYGLMLLIVINYEEPEIEKPGEQTAHYLAGQMEVPQSPRQGRRQKGRGGKDVPPAPSRGIDRVKLGRQYKFFPGSHAPFKSWRFRARFFPAPVVSRRRPGLSGRVISCSFNSGSVETCRRADR